MFVQMWYTMKNISIAAVDATNAIFTIHQDAPEPRHPTEKLTALRRKVKEYNEKSITSAKYPIYYKNGLGTIECIEYTLDNQHSPYYILTKRHRKYIRRVVSSGNVKKTLNYYCKKPKSEQLALVEVNGKVVRSSKIPDTSD